jgi:glutamyl-tRNA reductase
MRILAIGCNHRSAPVEVRERIAFNEAMTPRALQTLKERFPESEAVILSTCNRTEIYIARPLHGHPRVEELIEFISEFHNISPSEFAEGLYNYEDIDAVRHLLRVVSALDSMVLGESQILAQARTAFELAKNAATLGPSLRPLFERAFSVAKNIHTKTTIATGRVSIGSVAVTLAKQVFSRFNDKIVMMVGAGKMGELTLTHLLDNQPKEVWMTNRTDDRTAALVERTVQRRNIAVRLVPFADWIEQIALVDIVIASTGSREPLLTASQFAPISVKRKYRPLLFIDLAVPRNIDPLVTKHDGTYLYNIDDLQSVVELNVAQRREAVSECQTMIEANVLEFVQKLQGQDLAPLIAALQEHFKNVGDRELEWIRPKLNNISQRDRDLIVQLLHRVMQKLLHTPVQILNDKSSNGATEVYAQALRRLFDLKDIDTR